MSAWSCGLQLFLAIAPLSFFFNQRLLICLPDFVLPSVIAELNKAKLKGLENSPGIWKYVTLKRSKLKMISSPALTISPASYHQKTFVIDGTIGFVGGINISDFYQNTPAHTGEKRAHDIFCRAEGPVVQDIERNIVGRWKCIGRINAIWSPAGAVASSGAWPRVVSARSETRSSGRRGGRGRAGGLPRACAGRNGGEARALRRIVGVEVGVRVGAAGSEGDLGRGARGGDRGWLGGEVEVGEDGGDDGGVGDGGEDPHGTGAAGAHPQVVAEGASFTLHLAQWICPRRPTSARSSGMEAVSAASTDIPRGRCRCAPRRGPAGAIDRSWCARRRGAGRVAGWSASRRR